MPPQSLIKEIPNLINIDYDSSPKLYEGLLLFNYTNRVKSGYSFKYWEFDEYCAVLLNTQKEEKLPKYILDYCYEDLALKKLKDSILYHKLKLKFLKQEISTEERSQLFNLFDAKKKIIRATFLKAINDAGVDKKKLNLFETELTELTSLAGHFECQTLIPWFVPIYLDLKMLLHIYIRHTKETFLDKSNYRGRTLFQYKLKDIITLLKCVLQTVEEEIKEHFVYVASGITSKEFHRKRIFYNEDYYQLRINSEGRITQFHQLDK